MSNRIEELSQIVKRIVNNPHINLIFAESCTGGNVCGSLVRHCPGISSNVLGSYVVYTREAKQRWLNLNEGETEDCESKTCCAALARNVLKEGRKFTTNIIALAVVGDLDPDCGNKFHICIQNDFMQGSEFPSLLYTGEFIEKNKDLTKEQIRSRRIDDIIETCLLKLIWYITGSYK